MSRPQQPEIARSGRTDVDPDHAGEALEGKRAPRSKGKTGPVPPENQPGHHPPEEQDKPDLDAFAARFTADEPQEEQPTTGHREERPNAAEERNGNGEGGTEPPYLRFALYPVRLFAHAATWSRDYFKADHR